MVRRGEAGYGEVGGEEEEKVRAQLAQASRPGGGGRVELGRLPAFLLHYSTVRISRAEGGEVILADAETGELLAKRININ
jgi:hypothetical protein